MKKLILATFTILIFCIFLFAQAEENSPCPLVSVSGPSGLIQAGDSATFTAILSKETPNAKYKWTVDRGEIFDGQGTSSITVATKIGLEMNITATVEISGLPEICGIITASETPFGCPNPEAEKISEFVYSGLETHKSFLDEFAQKLKDDPNNLGYILIYSETGLSENDLSKREQKIRQYLIKEKNIEPDKFVCVNAGEIKNSVQLWLVPAGATPPIP